VNVIGDAYSTGASAWAAGPTLVYRRLADELIGFSPLPLAGRTVLDLGSGTGEGSRAALAAGARVVATDLALGMLQRARDARPAAAVGDARALPFRDGAVDLVLAPFCLNHLDEPADGVREAGRVAGGLLASTYASDDDHPVKAAVETALGEVGWARPSWYDALKQAMAAWGTIDAAAAVVARGGMVPRRVERRTVVFPDLAPTDMVAWRLGLAHHAAFFDQLDQRRQADVVDRAVELLGPTPDPVARHVIFLAAVSGAAG
jgi:SAM-dependent methyltransferase